jgi:hypothetical protein
MRRKTKSGRTRLKTKLDDHPGNGPSCFDGGQCEKRGGTSWPGTGRTALETDPAAGV